MEGRRDRGYVAMLEEIPETEQARNISNRLVLLDIREFMEKYLRLLLKRKVSRTA